MYSGKANIGGTGYGGDGRSDARTRKAGKQKASKIEKKRLLELEQSMKEGSARLLSEPPKPSLLSDVREVMRKQVPDEWTKSYSLYNAALDCCHLLSIHHAGSLGASDDPETIMSAFNDFAEHAEMIVKHDAMNNAITKKLASKIIEVHKIALAASSKAFRPKEMAVMDSHEHYREALRPYRFELVPNLKGHTFANRVQNSRLDLKKIFRELTAYKTALPIEFGSSIFVRAVENRLDLLRACITGPEDTPYANGAFLFDIYLSDYPRKPPQVKYLTTGGGKYRFNPNLYNDGKVCLSLLGTWSGPGWIAGESTLLQVLISIQSLILVNDPYFNEPGWESSRGTPQGTSKSDNYNKKIRRYTLEVCILPFLPKSSPSSQSSYSEFDEALHLHFRNKRALLQKQLYQWYTQDKSLQKLYMKFLDIVEQNFLKQKPRNAINHAATIETNEVDGIIEIRDEDNEATLKSKKRKERDIIILDDDDDVLDRKPAARATNVSSVPCAKSKSPCALIDLT